MNNFQATVDKTVHINLCGGESIEFADDFITSVNLVYQERSSGENVETYRSEKLNQIVSSTNSLCPVESFSLWVYENGVYNPWTNTTFVNMNSKHEIQTSVLLGAFNANLTVRAKTKYG